MKPNPVQKVHSGRPGRPADVRAPTERTMAAAIAVRLGADGLVAPSVPIRARQHAAKRIAEGLWHELQAAGLRVVPARFLSEIALFSGEPVMGDDASLPPPPKREE